jgi:hypothetical protein
LGGRKATDSSNDDLAMLFLFSSPCLSSTLRRNNKWSKRSRHNKKKREKRKKEGVQF